MAAPATLRLRAGALTVLLGAPADRRRAFAALDEQTVRCATAHAVPAGRLVLDQASAVERAAVLGRRTGESLLLVDRPTSGLDSPGRRTVLAALRDVARAGTAVLVEDDDPLPVLAVADAALRVDADGGVRADDLHAV